ncbi:hypothetical protein AQS8620_01734 [Aquimixticola soesokkakensis]|uniref:UPF0276 protein AQS8620_01734 n=1 Tax=Aquimixticola soesokkakensis TaxID=1519096 RepID=A0A1Y5SMA7_9RHOB|nr:DUF692 domain-containing protein [Aquimixticola soesokkakensis]SLN43664.1 hypothetical protein AQS8620_01734 [Aquimixticola soesokkakensis]
MPHLPACAGLGFKAEHFDTIRQQRPDIGFFEVHAENYMGAGGPPHRQLTALRADYAISLHGVGLSIGGSAPLDRAHLARLRGLIDRYQPESFSEHLAWSSHGGDYLNDLLPLPYTQATLAQVCAHIDQTQETLGRQILLENPATYLLFDESELPETEFLRAVAQRTGCGLLLDVNNVFVSNVNHRDDPRAYLADFPLEHVGELHLGGHTQEELPSGPLLIDAHGSPVADPVWALYADTLARLGPMPTLIEWDTDVPAFDVLLGEVGQAEALLAASREERRAMA